MKYKQHIGLLIRTPYLELMNILYAQLKLDGYDATNTMYSSIFQCIRMGERKLGEIAKFSNTSKQHAKFLLNNLEEMEGCISK